MMKLPGVGILLAVALLQLARANAFSAAPGISLSFDSLPSAQAWVYDGGSVPETSAFSVNGSLLEQDTMAQPISAVTLYSRYNVVNPTLSYTFEMTVRVLDHTPPTGWLTSFAFAVDSGSERIAIGITTNEIAKYSGAPGDPVVINTSIDVTQFHDYRLEGTPGVGWELFVDETSIGSGSFGLSQTNRLLFGDFTGAASAQAEISSLTFTQVPEPSAFALIGLGLIGLGMLRGHRRTQRC